MPQYRSRTSTHGRNMAGARSLWRATGMKDGDFGKPINERLLFPTIDHTLVPGESPEDDAAIRRAIVYLHERILGRVDAPESSEVDRSFQLLTMVVSDAAEKKGLERNEKYTCRQTTPPPPEDNHYTIRAWRAVITYLLRRPEFLYE